MEKVKVAIIGAGPAGIAVSIQLKRFGLNPIVFEKSKLGGLLHNANLVENYPGFPGGIAGIDLAQLMQKQFANHEIDLKNEQVINLDWSQDDNQFEICTETQKYSVDFVVVASGTTPKKLEGFENISDDLYYEVKDIVGICEKEIIIIGAGDAAFDYAINLSKNNSVKILNRGQEIKSLPLLVERCKEIDNIKYFEDIEVKSAKQVGGRLGLETSSEGEIIKISCDKVLAAIGREPSLSFLSENLINRKDKLISKERLYFIGDVKNQNFRQTSIAVGNGVLAAMKIYQKTLEGSE